MSLSPATIRFYPRPIEYTVSSFDLLFSNICNALLKCVFFRDICSFLDTRKRAEKGGICENDFSMHNLGLAEHYIY